MVVSLDPSHFVQRVDADQNSDVVQNLQIEVEAHLQEETPQRSFLAALGAAVDGSFQLQLALVALEETQGEQVCLQGVEALESQVGMVASYQEEMVVAVAG